MRLLREIKWAWQRVRRGWDDNVWWNLDNHLCGLCLDSLKKLRDKSFCYPGDLASMEEWQAKIDAMIDGFEAASLLLDITETPLWHERDRRWEEAHGEESPYSYKKIPGTEFSSFLTHPDMKRIEEEMGFWEAHKREQQALEARMRAGLGVFVERFLDLGD